MRANSCWRILCLGVTFGAWTGLWTRRGRLSETPFSESIRLKLSLIVNSVVMGNLKSTGMTMAAAVWWVLMLALPQPEAFPLP